MENIEFIPVLIGLVATGMISGLLAGLLGIGGGLVLVPVLYYLFQDMTPDPVTALATATATSLAIIVPTSISSIYAHFKRGNVDIPTIKAWWIWIVLGVFLAAAMVSWLRGPWLQVFFSIFTLTVGLKMFFGIELKKIPSIDHSSVAQSIIPFLIGFISTLVGIGGGTLTVPVLSAIQFTMARAIGTSAAVGFIISLPGALSLLFAPNTADGLPYSIGLINIPAFLFITPLSVAFAPIGAKFSQKIKPFYLKNIFALVLISTGIRIALQIL